MNIELGKIEEVDLRDIWKNEQYDFSKWLASEDGLNQLGDILGLSLVEPETEKFVGSYRCDIVCKDETSGKTILIENQLESSNHDHLGKIITYASGLQASVVVWIVQEAKEEHASAIEWLNDHVDTSVSFFLIEIHAIRIGNSKPAPQFKIIEQPNDFNIQSKNEGESPKTMESKAKRIEFWNQLNDYLSEHKTPFHKRKATTDHWYDFALGTSKCHLTMELINKDGYIRIGAWINSQEQYDSFLSHKEEIEKTVGLPLEWDKLKGKGARIYTRVQGLDFAKPSNYSELIDQSVNLLVKFREALKPYCN